MMPPLSESVTRIGSPRTDPLLPLNVSIGNAVVKMAAGSTLEVSTWIVTLPGVTLGWDVKEADSTAVPGDTPENPFRPNEFLNAVLVNVTISYGAGIWTR